MREAVVIAREDTPGDKRLVAYYTAAESGRPRSSAEALRASSVRDAAGVHGACGVCASARRCPLTPNGKLDRKALPAPEAMPTR